MSDGRIHIDGLKPADVALLKSVAAEAAELAVKKTFIAMGINPDNPLEAQADMQFLRATRQRCEGTEGKAIITAVGFFVISALGVFWTGFKALLH